MSLQAPRTPEEGKFQYCNYGYDSTKFKSFDDCMTNYNKVFNIESNTQKPSKFDYSGINEMLKNSIPFIPPFMQPIIKNGSDFNKQKSEIERQQILALEQKKYDAEKAMSDAQKNKTKEPIYYILVTAGVMIAGYFAYKKFKK